MTAENTTPKHTLLGFTIESTPAPPEEPHAMSLQTNADQFSGRTPYGIHSPTSSSVSGLAF